MVVHIEMQIVQTTRGALSGCVDLMDGRGTDFSVSAIEADASVAPYGSGKIRIGTTREAAVGVIRKGAADLGIIDGR